VHTQIMPSADEGSHPVARAVGAARQSSRQLEPPDDLPARADVQMMVGAADDVLAVNSLERAVLGEASLSDAGALAWVMLRNVAPCTSMALFLPDAAEDAVVARFAAGSHAATLRSLRVCRGTGVAGWCAANRHSVLNADPRLDLGPAAGTLSPPLLSSIALPLSTDGELVAVMVLYTSRPDGFSEDHQRLLELLAPSLGASVAAALEPKAARAGGVRTSALRLVGRH
jgi:hypothetical protein